MEQNRATKADLVREVASLRSRLRMMEAGRSAARSASALSPQPRVPNPQELLQDSEARLRESEHKYRLLAENVLDVVWTMDLEGRFTYISPSVTAQTGYLPEDYYRLPLHEALTPESASRVVAVLHQQLSRPPGLRTESVILELQEKTKSGGILDVEVHASWIRGKQGTPLGIIGVTRNITERKRAEQALRESEERYRILSSLATEGIAIHENGIIMDANQAFAQIVGVCNPEILIGKNGMDCIPFAEESRPALREWLAGDRSDPCEAAVLYPDGRTARLLIRARSATFRGRPVRIISTLDITDRHAAMEALRVSEAKFRTVGTSAPDALILINDAGLAEYWNPAAERMFGFSAAEMQGTNVHRKILPAGILDRYEPAFRVFQNTGRGDALGNIVELVGKRKDGSEFPVEITVNAIPVMDKYWAAAVIRDITDKKRAEEERLTLQEQLTQALKMEAVGRLAGGVAHDFNNLLTTILGYSELVLSRLPQEDPLRVELREIRKAGERAASLTQQLLAFSRKQIVQPRIVDINAVVHEAQHMLGRLIGENIRILYNLAPDLGRVKIDPHQIDQVLLNLAVNARDAMPLGGTLTISTSNTRLSAEDIPASSGAPPGAYIMLSVADTGVGMSAETRSRLFEPFFTTKDKGKGTGLGLAMIYGIAKQNGGTICVHSEPGRGSEFRFYLPPTSDAAEATGPEAPAATPTGVETVLLVEDEAMVRRLTQRMLLRLGYHVLEADGINEAIRICTEHSEPIHLLLTDIVMPGMSGIELYTSLREIRAEMTALFMSGYSEDAILRHGILVEGTEFIQKPFTMDALAHRLRKALESR